jgi:uncharacterized repeat protein (TIGR01451 family)/CSLREA domain-containing protein
VLAGCAVVLLVGVVPATTSHAQFTGATFVVGSAADQPDFDPGDGTCDSDPSPATVCTLRAAIQESNAFPSSDTIRFASSLSTIVPTVALPPIADDVELDGTVPSGRVELDGSSLAGTADGLDVFASGTLIENLRVKGFGGAGARLSAQSTLIGNVFLFNGNAGVVVDVGAAGTSLFGNSVAQNVGAGIRVLTGPVTIADTSVSGNTGAGIDVLAGSGVDISGGGFVSNGGLGLDLAGDGVTANDPDDADTGPNDLQNYPVLASATTTGTRPQTGQEVVVQGTIDTTGPVTLRFYFGDSCDASGNGEGTGFLGEATSVGAGPFTVTLPDAQLAAGGIVTATATSSGGSTSELSNCVAAVLVGADLGATKTASPGAGPGEFVTVGNEVRFLATIANAGPDAATNVTVLDAMPDPTFAAFVSATPSQGTCGTPNANRELTCLLGTLAAGASATIEVRVTPTFDSSINLTNEVFPNADQTDPVCTLEPTEPGQTDDPVCDGAEAVTHVEPAAAGQAGGFVAPGDTLSTGTTATAADSTVVSLTNNTTSGTGASLAELACPGSGDPLCSDPGIVGGTLADVSVGGAAAAAATLAAPSPAPAAPYTATLLYDRSVLTTTRVQAFHVYAGTTRLAACSRRVPAPCLTSLKLLSGSKDLQVKVSLVGSAKLRTSTG